ncbi:MBL fold metallo-hydrolase [Rhodospirillaceae bacterium SYSU D60014]|uniref:MBL fold metallo-hydrolase n=1 Tax=Virgifigura deserti TaxID=2268457 RepID=UPI000E66F84B
MIEVTFLGTAASIPSAERGLSSLLVRQGGERFLVDCGEGTQRQLIRSGIGFRRLDRVLLTHGHLDHLLGLGGLAGTINLWRTTDRLTIHAGAAALRLARTLLLDVTWPAGPPPLALEFVEVLSGPIYESEALRVTAFPVRHHAPDCFGFLFEERRHQPLIRARLEELGVPSGPERARLAGGEPVTLPDGRHVDPEDVLGPAKPGARLAVIGDTESVEDLVDHVRDADALVIESTFLDTDADKARARSHLTIGQAAWLARTAGIERLYLTHISSRYRLADIEAEAAAAFPRVSVARDFDRFQV